MIGDRIKNLRISQHLSQADFSSKIGISQSYLSAVERNAKTPGSEVLISLKNLFKFNTDWLLTGEGEMYATKYGGKERGHDKKQDVTPVQQPQNDRLNDVLKRVETLEIDAKKRETGRETIQIPLFMHAVAAGDPCGATSDIEKYITVPKEITRHPESTWAVRANGDSMIGAGIETGDILIADNKAPVKHRCIVIASINGAQTVKRILIQKGAVILSPENSNYDSLVLKETDDVKILGTILYIIRQVY